MRTPAAVKKSLKKLFFPLVLVVACIAAAAFWLTILAGDVTPLQTIAKSISKPGKTVDFCGFTYHRYKSDDSFSLIGFSGSQDESDILYVYPNIDGLPVKTMGKNSLFSGSVNLRSKNAERIYLPWSLTEFRKGTKVSSDTVYFYPNAENEVSSSFYRKATLVVPYSSTVDWDDGVKYANVAYMMNFEGNPNQGYFFIDLWDDGDLLTPPPYLPSREGHYFLGWYKDAECTEPWDFANDRISVEKNAQDEEVFEEVRLYAKWKPEQKYPTAYFWLNLSNDKEKDLFSKQILVQSESLKYIYPSPREGLYFNGWYKDPECTEKWNFETDIFNIEWDDEGYLVAEELNLYAAWIDSIDADVLYEYNYPNSDLEGFCGAALANADGTLNEPNFNFIGYKYTLLGWYKDAECTEKWDFQNDRLAAKADENGNQHFEPIVLYAKWCERIRTEALVYYNISGKANTSRYIYDDPFAQIRAGVLSEKLNEPVREGYIFLGWYKDEACTEKWDFEKDFAGNGIDDCGNLLLGKCIRFYAGWLRCEGGKAYYLYECVDSYSEYYIEHSDLHGRLLGPPEPPTREGYIFLGWYKDAACTEKWDFENDRLSLNAQSEGVFFYVDCRLYPRWEKIEE